MDFLLPSACLVRMVQHIWVLVPSTLMAAINYPHTWDLLRAKI